MADILELIAVDPPNSVVTRLINSHNKVTTCRRKKNEDLSVFVSIFPVLAAEHLMHSNLISGSQIAEVLAITLLNNFNLEEGRLTNSKLQLISRAENEARGPHGDLQETVQVPRSFLKDVEDLK